MLRLLAFEKWQRLKFHIVRSAVTGGSLRAFGLLLQRPLSKRVYSVHKRTPTARHVLCVACRPLLHSLSVNGYSTVRQTRVGFTPWPQPLRRDDKRTLSLSPNESGLNPSQQHFLIGGITTNTNIYTRGKGWKQQLVPVDLPYGTC